MSFSVVCTPGCRGATIAGYKTFSLLCFLIIDNQHYPVYWRTVGVRWHGSCFPTPFNSVLDYSNGRLPYEKSDA